MGVLGNVAGAILIGYWALTTPTFIVGLIAAIWLLYWAVKKPKAATLIAVLTITAGLIGHAAWRAHQLIGMPLFVEAYQTPDGLDTEVARAAAAQCGARMSTYRNNMNIDLPGGQPGGIYGRPYLSLFISTRKYGGTLLYSVERAADYDPIDDLWQRVGVSDKYLVLEEAQTAADISDGVCKIMGAKRS